MTGNYLFNCESYHNTLMTDMGLIPLLSIVSLRPSELRGERMKNNALALDKAKS